MFQAMRGPDRVEAVVLEITAHVGQGTDVVWFDSGVDVDRHLLPIRSEEGVGKSTVVQPPGPGIEKPLPHRRLVLHIGHLSRIERTSIP